MADNYVKSAVPLKSRWLHGVELTVESNRPRSINEVVVLATVGANFLSGSPGFTQVKTSIGLTVQEVKDYITVLEYHIAVTEGRIKP